MTKYVVLDFCTIWGVGLNEEAAIADAKKWLDSDREYEFKDNHYYPDTDSMYLLECTDAFYAHVLLFGSDTELQIVEKENKSGHVVYLDVSGVLL